VVRSFPAQIQGCLLALVAGGAYFLTYRVNELFDGIALFAQGINLIFLPAGIKHLAILLAGAWGALGCLIALFVLAQEFWQGAPTGSIAIYSVVSTCATWLGIALSLRLMGIGKDLRQLKFTHLPMMDLITTALHGFLTNAYFMMAGMKSERWIENALAMMLGDFVGSFFILMLLWFGLSVFRKNDKN
jgi:hypothetical protein